MGTAWVTCDHCRNTAAESEIELVYGDDGAYCSPRCRRAAEGENREVSG